MARGTLNHSLNQAHCGMRQKAHHFTRDLWPQTATVRLAKASGVIGESSAMATPKAYRTDRLVLRQWQWDDLDPFVELNADPAVMRYFPNLGTRDGAKASIDTWMGEIDERGWSNWAVETTDSRQFIGFVGITNPKRALHFTPCVEIGWRLAKQYWHRGYATEAAKKALEIGFVEIGLGEIVSFTSAINNPSRAVMARLGMKNTDEDFDHPALPNGSELQRHCLYKITRQQWAANAA